MSQHTQERVEDQVAILASDDFHTRYAGVIALQRLWQQLNVSGCLAESEIRYGQGRDKASSFAFALTLGPLVQANSVRKVAQRFGGEPSPHDAERDKLLSHLVAGPRDQRTLSRFVNQARYDWSSFVLGCIEELQQAPDTQLQADGVLILDDFPVPKPYAQEMDYLEKIWDVNQERRVPGYHVVHCYYHHPTQPSYSLLLEPWRKTSRTGETEAKPPNAQRRVQAGEERSKLDIALDGLEQLRPYLPTPVPVIFDGWYFARWFVAALSELGYDWISQAGVQRKFEVAAGYLSVPAIIDHYRDQLQPVPELGESIQAYALPALLRADKYTRHAQPVQLVLVRGLCPHKDEKEGKEDLRLLVCNRRDWSSQQILTRFAYRPQVEQAHRTGKQLAGWTAFHSRSWASHEAHWALAWVRSLLLALLPFGQPALQDYSLAQIIQLGLQAAARFVVRSAHKALPAIYRPRDQPVLQACLL